MSNLRTTASLLTMMLLATPALAQSHGSSAASHSASTSAAIRSTAPAARIATTPLSSSPTAIAPGAVATSSTNTAPMVTTTTSSLALSQAPGSPPNLSSANPGVVDQNTATDPIQIQAPSGAPGTPSSTTSSTATSGDQAAMPTTGDQILGANGVQLPNVGATTSGGVPAQPNGAVPGQVATSRGEVDATSGGSSGVDLGATGRDVPECMKAWDTKTHITKSKWRQICARTLEEPHI